MISRIVLNFIFVIYSNSSQLTYSLIRPLVTARSVLSMNKVCLVFLELSMVLAAHVVLLMTKPNYMKIIFLLLIGKIGQAQDTFNV